jgi:hypothetical protein
MRAVRSFAALGFLLACVVALSSCQVPGAAAVDDTARQNAILLKAETVALMGLSSEPFAQHQDAVAALTGKIEAAYQLAAVRPRGELIAREWQVLKDPERDLYGGFVKRWQTSGKLSPAFRDAITGQVGQAFDMIVCLEGARQTGGRCSVGGA